jgi:hypothetical protein
MITFFRPVEPAPHDDINAIVLWSLIKLKYCICRVELFWIQTLGEKVLLGRGSEKFSCGELTQRMPTTGKNVEMTVEGNILKIKVDLSKEFGPSSSGKTDYPKKPITN